MEMLFQELLSSLEKKKKPLNHGLSLLLEVHSWT